MGSSDNAKSSQVSKLSVPSGFCPCTGKHALIKHQQNESDGGCQMWRRYFALKVLSLIYAIGNSG